MTGQDLSLFRARSDAAPRSVQSRWAKMSEPSRPAKADAAAASASPSRRLQRFRPLPKEVVSASYYVTDPRWSKQVVELLLPSWTVFWPTTAWLKRIASHSGFCCQNSPWGRRDDDRAR